MAELITIPVSFLELTMDYERPAIRLLTDRVLVMQGVLDVLEPWNASLDDIEVIAHGKFSQQGVMFRIPLKHFSFFLGATSCRFGRENIDWSSADETIAMIDAVICSVTTLSGVAMAKMTATLGMHIQPRTTTYLDLLNPFMAPRLATLEKEPLRTMAIVAKWGKRGLTLDGSAMVANGVFIKIEREFDGTIKYTDIAAQLKKDEDDVFGILGVREDQR